MNVLSLFAGIGGIELRLERSGRQSRSQPTMTSKTFDDALRAAWGAGFTFAVNLEIDADDLREEDESEAFTEWRATLTDTA